MLRLMTRGMVGASSSKSSKRGLRRRSSVCARLLLTVRMFEVSPRASLTHAFADLHCVFGLICRLVRAAIPSKCQSDCVA